MSFAYMPFYTGDYYRDTRHLSMMQHGAYRLLLDHCWDQRGPLPLDIERCYRICGAVSKEEQESVRSVRAEFFVQMEDGWYNPRLQRELQRCDAISEKRSVAGKARHGLATPVPVRNGQRLRSARMSAARAKGTHTSDEWDAMVDFHDGKCAKCGSDETMMIKDHILSVMRGGSDSIENLQPLCWKCNHAKGGGDDTDHRRKGWQKHLSAHADHMLADAKDVVQSPSPSPSPSSTPSSTPSPAPDPAQPSAASGGAPPGPPMSPPATPTETSSGPVAQKRATRPAPTAEVWAAYASAYEERYGVPPVRNAKINGMLSQFVSRLGADEAVGVARFYVTSRNGLYVSAKHCVDLMLRDAEKLHTEWRTGNTGYQRDAQEQDRLASTGAMWERVGRKLAEKGIT